VHLLVRVVVDVSAPDKLDADPQAPPPQAEAAKTVGPIAKKRSPAIATDDLRHTVAAEQPGADSAYSAFIPRAEMAGVQDESRPLIAYGQRLDLLVIGRREPAL
jgi:hypothetical protein